MRGDSFTFPRVAAMLDVFYDELARKPDDWAVRGLLADWCEDNNLPQWAECLRWMIRHRKRPYRSSGRLGFTWFNADKLPDVVKDDPESNIPGKVWDLLAHGQQAASHKSYPTLRAAEEDFYDAWAKARSGGWKPDGVPRRRGAR
jgi:hypothetical protein